MLLGLETRAGPKGLPPQEMVYQFPDEEQRTAWIRDAGLCVVRERVSRDDPRVLGVSLFFAVSPLDTTGVEVPEPRATSSELDPVQLSMF